ncbi:MAG: DUF6166 domain-containing protein [Spirochaetota bacterium]
MKKIDEYHELIMMHPIELKGDYKSKRIWINDKELIPEFSRKLYNHSGDGFDWAHSGSGAAQLALAVLFELTNNKKISMILHHVFKNDYVKNLPPSDFKIKINMGNWFIKQLSKNYMFPE